MSNFKTHAKALRTYVGDGYFYSFFSVTKPGVVAMVLVAAVSGMYVAGGTLPQADLVFWTLIAVGLSSAGAATLNNYIDRDIDLIMRRTSGRVLPTGAAPVNAIYWYGIALCAISLLAALLFINLLTAALTALAIFMYVVMYTMLTKRRTPIATFIGGVGGALPPVLGYTAVANTVDEFALALFLVIFTWQHPHFWSLALKYVEEYRAADVSNLPVVRGVKATKIQITIWSVLMAMAATLPYLLSMAGVYYLGCALLLAVIHIFMALRFQFSDLAVDMRLFFFSIIHLPALYCVMLLDML